MNSSTSLAFTKLRRFHNLSLKVMTSWPFTLAWCLILIYGTMLTPYAYHLLGGDFNGKHLSSLVFLIGYGSLLFFIIPASICKFVFRQPLADFGLTLPQQKTQAFLLILLALAVLIPFIYYFSTAGNFQKYYRLDNGTSATIILANLTLFPIYYFTEEFFFRGFLFLVLWRKVGWHSFWMTDIIFALAHTGKPGMEILLCIPVSIIFNCLTLATRSIWPAWVVHLSMGAILFILVNFNFL